MGNPDDRRSFWGWGLAVDEPSQANREALAAHLGELVRGGGDGAAVPDHR